MLKQNQFSIIRHDEIMRGCLQKLARIRGFSLACTCYDCPEKGANLDHYIFVGGGGVIFNNNINFRNHVKHNLR